LETTAYNAKKTIKKYIIGVYNQSQFAKGET